jgi:hypothetical protein
MRVEAAGAVDDVVVRDRSRVLDNVDYEACFDQRVKVLSCGPVYAPPSD